MPWEWAWTGRDILVGIWALQYVDICSASTLQNSPDPTGTGQTRSKKSEASALSPEPFFSQPCRFREPRLGGPEVEAVGGVGGALGLGAGGGLWAAGGPIVVTGVPCPVPARLCSAGAWRQRKERGAYRAPEAGPMASCASIDIEDATQHLRDILKLDRPAGGKPGQRGWALAERAEGWLGPGPPSRSVGPSGSLCILPAGEGSGKPLSIFPAGRRPPVRSLPIPVPGHFASSFSALAEGEAPFLNPKGPPGVLALRSLVFLVLIWVPNPFAILQRPSPCSEC